MGFFFWQIVKVMEVIGVWGEVDVQNIIVFVMWMIEYFGYEDEEEFQFGSIVDFRYGVVVLGSGGKLNDFCYLQLFGDILLVDVVEMEEGFSESFDNLDYIENVVFGSGLLVRGCLVVMRRYKFDLVVCILLVRVVGLYCFVQVYRN